MSRTLTLIPGAWSATRSLARCGRRADALARVTTLLARPDLPAATAAEAHRLAAELLIETEQYPAARRHVRAAAALEPRHAKTFYLAGLAQERDPDGSDRRAAVRFRKASTLEPGNALYRAAFGRAAFRCDAVKTGVRELVAAADAAADNGHVLRIVVDGLVEAGKVGTARRVLVKARFLRPHGADVRRLWERVRFEAARVGQRNTRGKHDTRFATDGEVVHLSFVRVVRADEGRTAGGGRVRRDVISFPRPHLARFKSTKADR